jgi:hypothetical protein
VSELKKIRAEPKDGTEFLTDNGAKTNYKLFDF